MEDGVLYLQPTLTRDTIGIDNVREQAGWVTCLPHVLCDIGGLLACHVQVMGVEPFRMDLWGKK